MWFLTKSQNLPCRGIVTFKLLFLFYDWFFKSLSSTVLVSDLGLLNLIWLFGSRLELIFATASAASKTLLNIKVVKSDLKITISKRLPRLSLKPSVVIFFIHSVLKGLISKHWRWPGMEYVGFEPTTLFMPSWIFCSKFIFSANDPHWRSKVIS